METTKYFKSILKDEGLRYTQQRQAIWDEIKSSNKHRQAEDIYYSLRQKKVNVSRATVYRTIDVLVKYRMVRKLEIGAGPAIFEHRLNNDHHDHLICLHCGKIVEFCDKNIEKIQKKIADEKGFKLTGHSHQLFGYCREYPNCDCS